MLRRRLQLLIFSLEVNYLLAPGHSKVDLTLRGRVGSRIRGGYPRQSAMSMVELKIVRYTMKNAKPPIAPLNPSSFRLHWRHTIRQSFLGRVMTCDTILKWLVWLLIQH